MTGAEQARDLADDLAHIARFRESTEVNPQSVMAACLRTIDALSAAEADLREAREQANAYRIESEHAMRDYEALEGVAFLALGHLSVVNRMPRVREAKALLDEALTGEGPKAALARAGDE